MDTLAATPRAPRAITAVLGLGIAAAGIAYADELARHSNDQLHFAVFWASYLLGLIAVVRVGAHRATGNRTRVLLLLGYAVVAFLPKFLMSVQGPVYFDEYGHFRHAVDIASTGHVNAPSQFLPIIQYYPGLEVLTAWIHRLTGLPIWHVGQGIVLVAHCAVLLVVLVMTRALGLSDRAAFLAALVYSLNSSYLYFDTQFSYESLGLPLAYATVCVVVLARRASSPRRAALGCFAALPLGFACIATHHISAAAMVAMLIVISAFVPPREEMRKSDLVQWGPIGVALALAVGLVLWLTIVAPTTYDYLAPHVRAGFTELNALLHGRTHTETFQNGQIAITTRHTPFAGSGAPIYEIAAAFLAPVLVAIATLGALVQTWRDRRNVQRLALLAPFFLLTVFYFLSLPLALTVGGGETGHRAWGLAYLGVAVLVVSSGQQWARWTRRLGRRTATVLAVGAMCVVGMGNTAAGLNVASRFPGPYQFGTDTRSGSAEVDQLVGWLRANLPAKTKVITDRFTGEQVTGYTKLLTPSPADYGVFYLYAQGGQPTPMVRNFIAARNFRYWILDTRIETQKPQQTFFQGYNTSVTVDPQALRTAGDSGYLRLVHSTDHYEVFEIQSP